MCDFGQGGTHAVFTHTHWERNTQKGSIQYIHTYIMISRQYRLGNISDKVIQLLSGCVKSCLQYTAIVAAG